MAPDEELAAVHDALDRFADANERGAAAAGQLAEDIRVLGDEDDPD